MGNVVCTRLFWPDLCSRATGDGTGFTLDFPLSWFRWSDPELGPDVSAPVGLVLVAEDSTEESDRSTSPSQSCLVSSRLAQRGHLPLCSRAVRTAAHSSFSSSAACRRSLGCNKLVIQAEPSSSPQTSRTAAPSNLLGHRALRTLEDLATALRAALDL